MYFPVFASFLYHLSEVKHNLPGLMILNEYHQILLNIDRAYAGISFIIVIFNLRKVNIILGLLGLVCLAISERDIIYGNLFGKDNIPRLFTVTHFDFLIFHVLWHFSAFYSLAAALDQNIYVG
jgi:hypothetical protein